MGSVKEDIAGIIAALPKGTVGITDPAWANKRLQQAYPKADQILSLVCKRIEGDEILERVLQKEFAQLYVRDMEAMSNGTERPAPLTVIREILQAYRQAIIDVIKEK